MILDGGDASAGSPVLGGGGGTETFGSVLEEFEGLGCFVNNFNGFSLEGEHCFVFMFVEGGEFVVSSSVGLSRVGVVDFSDESINNEPSGKSGGVVFEGLEVVSPFGNVAHEFEFFLSFGRDGEGGSGEGSGDEALLNWFPLAKTFPKHAVAPSHRAFQGFEWHCQSSHRVR